VLLGRPRPPFPAPFNPWLPAATTLHSACGFCGQAAFGHERRITKREYCQYWHFEIENPFTKKIKMCNFLRPQKHLKKGQLSDVSPMMCFTCCCWSSTFHNRRADNKQLEPSTRPARWVRRQQQQQQQGQQAPLCCQFKMIKQTNINPLQVDACGCRLMALSDSPATLEPIRCDPGIWDWDSESPRLWECATVSSPPCPISISSHSERHSHCHGLNAVPGHNDF